MRRGFMRGTVIGALIGGVAALLLAPKPGKELREDIADEGRRRIDQAKKASGSVRQQFDKGAGKAKGRANKAQSDAAGAVADAAGVVEKKAATVRRTARKRTTPPKTK